MPRSAAAAAASLLPLQAIANILDAYSRVGCSSPEVVDKLVAQVGVGQRAAGRIAPVVPAVGGGRGTPPAGRRVGRLGLLPPAASSPAVADALAAAPSPPRLLSLCRRSPPLSPPPAQAAEHPSTFDAACLAKVATAVIKLGYSDEALLLPLLDCATLKLGDIAPKAVVELVRD